MAKDKKPEDGRSGISRRDFFRSGAAGAVSTGLISHGMAQGRTEAGVPVVGPGPVSITLNVNGKSHQIEVEPRVTLLDALRNHLDITGAKKVCDRTSCGACTMLLDGKPVYGCTTLAIEVQGRDIETVESLGDPENLHPIQRAFVENDAQQCGFCTPGFIVACKAFLDENPSPTLEQVEKGLGGNLCRCGTYAGIKQALVGGGQNA